MLITSKVTQKFRPVALLAAGLFISLASACACGVRAFAKVTPANDLTLTIRALGRTYEFSYPEIDFDGNEYYLKNAAAVADGIFLDTVTRPFDASYTVDRNSAEPFRYVAEKNGRGINRDKLLADVTRALNGGKRSVTAEEVVLRPNVTLGELKSRTKLLSSFETSYKTSGAARKKNIALACEYIGYRTLNPRCEFSFNAAVGERTESRGFGAATVIVGGEFTSGVGGGVCQVSSTLYACAVNAGMRVTQRRRHTLLVGYTAPSFDAMVSDGASDLRFINSSDYPVVLVADADGERVRIRLYGKPDGKTYKFTSEITQLIEPDAPKIVECADLDYGVTVVKTRPARGAKSKGWLFVFKDGRQIEKRLMSSDAYPAVCGITLKGTKIPSPDKAP